MKDRYENKQEDSIAIRLIEDRKIDNLNQLENLFSEELLPLRERYVFYFIGIKHSLNPELKEFWNTDNCPYRFWNLKSDWWERYLQYYRPMKLKLRKELNPELQKPEYPEVEKAIQGDELHKLFLKTGYNYKKEMDSYMDKWMLTDWSNPNAKGNSINLKSPINIWDELKDIDREFDTYELKIVPNKRHVESQWCPACHESPCMCSDPF
ncbi:hypothetical protein E1J38_014975 [Seonamhaeicola sediminis]|uniref:Uncharacterized protein n=1 Tax=Seonamhaeicola sediminis TaxID=2528206 RepID=A0A562Y5E7_9FLAO|nr:hypothetical protein [Seonamhaeicola sediminis]TWO29624.1 hypothetical protein E1J38_014975 [Seonamhaeicola sediminis]